MRFAATKLIEGDPLILERLGLDQNEKETLEHLILQMEKRTGAGPQRCDCRYAF